MDDWLDLERLVLSADKPSGYVPTPTSSLMERVRDHGPIQPVVVRPLSGGQFEILANAETWVAAGRAGLHRVPVTVRDDIHDQEARDIVRSHYAETERSPIDEARYFVDQLEMFGGQHRRGAVGKLAKLLGRSRSSIAHSLRLLRLPNAVQQLIQDGRLSPGQSRPLVSLRDPNMQKRVAELIVSQNLSSRGVERLIRNFRTTKTITQQSGSEVPPKKTADELRFERQVSDLIGARFTLDEGKAVINYAGNLDVLQGIVERLGYRGG